MKTTIAISIILAISAVAGCATPAEKDTMTPTHTATPTAVTPTPTMTTPATPSPPALPECPAPPAPSTTSSNVTELTFTVKEPSATDPCYGILGPTSAPSGWLKITVQNSGRELHQVAFMKLEDQTFAEYHSAMMGAHGDAMAAHNGNATAGGPTPFGGPIAGPGGNTTALLYLDPGEYAVVCLVPDMKGTPHVMSGMIARFYATNETSAEVEPTADLELHLTDYGFSWSENVTAGAHVIKIENKGPHHHEAVLVQLAGNATSADFLAAFAPDATGPPPVLSVGGVAGMDAGKHAYVWADITPGNWALLCFEQDSADAPPHFVLGMVQDFVVV